MVSARQMLVITRFLGLEVAAAWSIGTRAFGLAVQLIGRISDMAAPVICEMLNRGERIRLARRYEELTVVKLAFSGWAAVAFALCNSAFVAVWTQGRIRWSPV